MYDYHISSNKNPFQFGQVKLLHPECQVEQYIFCKVFVSNITLRICWRCIYSFQSNRRFFEELSDENNWNVALGEHNQYRLDVGEQIIKPEQFFVYPEFLPHETSQYFKLLQWLSVYSVLLCIMYLLVADLFIGKSGFTRSLTHTRHNFRR